MSYAMIAKMHGKGVQYINEHAVVKQF